MDQQNKIKRRFTYNAYAGGAGSNSARGEVNSKVDKNINQSCLFDEGKKVENSMHFRNN